MKTTKETPSKVIAEIVKIKIKIGDFEKEIGVKEARELKNQLVKLFEVFS